MDHEDILKLYSTYTGGQESPDIFHRWACLSTIANITCRQIYMDRGPEGILYPNIYAILVAGSALCRKNTAIALGTRILHRVRDRREQNGLGSGMPAILRGKVTTAALCVAMSEVGLQTMHSNPTSESGEKTSRPIYLVGAELGVLISKQAQMDGFVDLITEAYTGEDSLENVTKTSGIDEIYAPCINLIGGTTPAWIADNVTSNVFNQGFAGRCVFAFAERPRKLVPFPAYTSAQLSAMERIVDLLYEKSFLMGEAKLETKAKDTFEQWYMARTPAMDDERVETGFYGREHAHVLKTSMLISLARRNDLTVKMADLKLAFKWIGEIRDVFGRVFQNITFADEKAGVRHLQGILRTCGRISHSDLMRKVWTRLNKEDLKNQIETLQEAGLVDVIEVQGDRGRPGRYYQWNGKKGEAL